MSPISVIFTYNFKLEQMKNYGNAFIKIAIVFLSTIFVLTSCSDDILVDFEEQIEILDVVPDPIDPIVDVDENVDTSVGWGTGQESAGSVAARSVDSGADLCVKRVFDYNATEGALGRVYEYNWDGNRLLSWTNTGFFSSGDELTETYTYTYSDDGKISSIFVENWGTQTWTYDLEWNEEGLLVSYGIDGNLIWRWEYDGLLVAKFNSTDQLVLVQENDEFGNLLEEWHIYPEDPEYYTNHATYEYEESGHKPFKNAEVWFPSGDLRYAGTLNSNRVANSAAGMTSVDKEIQYNNRDFPIFIEHTLSDGRFWTEELYYDLGENLQK